jgi:hypothetical protein
MKCTHCTEKPELVVVPADEPWHDEHYQCPNCDSTYPIWEEELGIKEAVVQFEWMIVDEKEKLLAYKKPDEDPVFIDAEGAVLQMIKTWKSLHNAHLNTSNLLADLSRML